MAHRVIPIQSFILGSVHIETHSSPQTFFSLLLATVGRRQNMGLGSTGFLCSGSGVTCLSNLCVSTAESLHAAPRIIRRWCQKVRTKNYGACCFRGQRNEIMRRPDLHHEVCLPTSGVDVYIPPLNSRQMAPPSLFSGGRR